MVNDAKDGEEERSDSEPPFKLVTTHLLCFQLCDERSEIARMKQQNSVRGRIVSDSTYTAYSNKTLDTATNYCKETKTTS